MNDNTRAYYEGQLSHHFLTARADAFQTLFEKLMGKAHPADFIACRPWGKVGDRKNDGYLPSERTLFQVYAPNQMRAADAIAKIDEDFKGALSHWKEHFDNWVFVHNAHEGLSPQILDKLLELQSQHAPLKLASWGLEELRQRLQRIPLDGLQSLFGFPPTSHLAPSTLPFVPVRDARIYGTDTDPNAFSPSLREFEERLVHRPVLAEQVEAALIERRFACLLGTGASGKTTLALVLAFSKLFGPEQSYYFDLAEADESSEAAESYRVAMQAIASQHGRDALLILDNIHLAEPLAQRLHLAWREEGQPVRLLLQGRFTQQGADRRGRQAPLEEIRRTALVLEVTPNDLVGVLQRLLRRTKSNLPVPQIPPAVLGEWLKVYGGELIAFSSAARRKLAQIVGGQHQLTEADAADFIRDEYLENQDPKQRIDSVERENLLAIAACADLELSLPAEGLPHAPGSALAVSLRRGLVWQSSHGRYGQFVRYRLCHPGMGKLLWEAAKPNTTRLDLACALAERSPFFGFTLGIRLARMQSDQDATKRVLASAVGGSDAFERLIEHGMTMLHDQCRRLTYFGVLSPSELDQGLASCRTLRQTALATHLGHVATFLKYAKTTLPKTWQVLAGTLEDEGHRQTLAKAAFATPLDHLVGFLIYAKSALPKAWQALADILADERHRQTLTQAAFATPLNHLVGFLIYAKRMLPKVWQASADILADEKNREALAQNALSAPLAELANVLVYTKTLMPTVWQALADTLGDQKNRQVLAQTALSTPVGHLASFLEYARKPLPKVWLALGDTLVDPKNRAVLGQAALTTPLAHLANFLVYTETSMPKVWEVLDVTLADQKNLQKLAQTALSTPVAGLANFLAYTKTSMPAVWQVLADTLAGQKNRQTLVQAVLVTPLDHLASFLKIPMPKVWQALADSLAEQKNLQILIQTALATPLGHLASFLESAKTPLPKVWQALADTLADEKNRQTLAQTTLATPLHSLASFLEYAKTLMPKVWQALADTLADQKNRQTLLQATLTTGFSNLAGFMSYLGGALPNVAEALNTEMAREFNASGIEHVRLQVLPGDPRGFPDAERVLLGCGCRDLARALAGRLIEAADRSVWHVRGVHFNEVTTVLRLANTGDEPAIRRFLDQVVTKDWLQTQYEKVPPQLIAIALHVLWAYTPHYVCDHFLAAFPIPRVEAFIRFLHQVGPARAIPNIELLGASSLFNVDICGTTRQWPTQAGLDEIARHFFCGLGEKRLDSHQILFLAGLREMVRRRAHRIRFAPEIGERALTLLKATDSPLPNHQRLDAWLSDWLDRCAKHGWQLLRDNIPVPESVVLEPPILPATTDVSPKRETASQGRDQLATTGPT